MHFCRLTYANDPQNSRSVLSLRECANRIQRVSSASENFPLGEALSKKKKQRIVMESGTNNMHKLFVRKVKYTRRKFHSKDYYRIL